MRLGWIMVALVGCYRPSATLLEDGSLDADPPDSDVEPDGKPDATLPVTECLTSTFMGNTSNLLITGRSFTTDGVIAIYDDGTVSMDPVRLRQTSFAAPDAGTALAFQAPPSAFTLGHPKLAPTGDDLYMLGTDGSTTAHLLKSRRVLSGKWSSPNELTVELPNGIVTLDGGFRPGVPSNTDPRMMVASQIGSNVLLLGKEEGLIANRWTFEPLNFAFAQVSDPYLSSDGRAVVFVGRDEAAGNIQIYRSTRPDVDTSFDPPIALHNLPTGNPETPAMTPDCKTLLWSNNEDNGIFSLD